jgi:WD40 repeat protein/tetratricopeptide (TPR) repeat protein
MFAQVVDADEIADQERIGDWIGRYRILEQIGEGGFGVVYMAEQREPVRRKVALKIIKAGMDTKEVIARFEAERQALALMDHPNIAKVLDAGATETGRPYFVMELVHGIPITKFCDQNRLNTWQRLELFLDVCAAVQHAHQKAVIHRDLKPSNILVTLSDGRPIPQVIDFGIAKAIGQELTEKTLFTAFGRMVGTPQYMSPEQATMSGPDIDTRSDIYALGVLLYELLTGSTPIPADDMRHAAYEKMLQLIRETEPQKPSTRITSLGAAASAIADHRGEPPDKLSRLLRGDLDWIVLRALEKNRNRRYETANEFARDIERHRNHEAVHAAAPSTIYLFCKFVRRHREMVAAASLVSLALAVGLIASTIGFVRAQRERSRAMAAEEEAVTQRDAAIAARAETEQERDRARRGLARRQLDRGLRRLEQGDSHGLLNLLDACATAEQIPAFRNTAAQFWSIAAAQVEGRLVHVLGGESHVAQEKGEIGSTILQYTIRRYSDARTNTDLAFSPDGNLIARGWGSTVWMWDTSTGRPHGEPAVLNEMIDSLAFSPDGTLLAAGMTAGGTYRGSFAHILDTATGQLVDLPRDCPVGAGVSSIPRNCGHRGGVAFSALGDLVALVTSNKTVEVWAIHTGEKKGTFPFIVDRTGEDEFAATFSPDGKLLAVASRDSVQLWDLSTAQRHGPPLECPYGGGIKGVLFTLAGDLLVTYAPYSGIFVWDLANFQQRQLLPRLEHKTDLGIWYKFILDLVLSPDDRLLAAGMDDGKILLVEIATGRLHGEQPMEHLGPVTAVRFSPDGKLLATSSIDGTVSLWEVAGGHRYGSPLYHGEEVAIIAFSPDGEHLASLTVDGTVRIWRVPDPPRHRSIPLPGDMDVEVAFSPDGRLLATTVRGKLDYLPLWDTTTWKPHHRWPVQPGYAGVSSAQFSPDGRWIAASATDGVIRLWNLAREEFEPGGFVHDRAVGQVAFNPGTTRIAAGIVERHARPQKPDQVYVWDVASRKPACPPVAIHGPAGSLAFNTDGRSLAIAETFVWIRDITTAKTRRIHVGDQVGSLTFSPDGSHLATGSRVHRVQLWDVDTGRLEGDLVGHSQRVGGVAYSPDGKLLASACHDGTVRLWAAELGAPWLSLVLPHPAPVFSVAFSSDGRLLATGSEIDSTAWICRLPAPPRELREMQLRTWLALGARHDPDGDVQTIGWEEWPRLREELQHLQPHRKGEGADVARERIGEGDAWFGRYKLAVGYMKDAKKMEKGGEIQEAEEAFGQARTVFEGLAEDFPDIEAYRILLEKNEENEGAMWYRRAKALAELNEWSEAATAFSKALALDVDPLFYIDAPTLNQWAWQLATWPDVKNRDPQAAVVFAEAAVEAAPSSLTYRNTLGAAYYRAGLWDEAIEVMGKGSWDFFFLAMAHWQRGEQEKAQMWYNRAVEWMEKHAPENKQLRRFRTEATALLGITETAAESD